MYQAESQLLTVNVYIVQLAQQSHFDLLGFLFVFNVQEDYSYRGSHFVY